MLRDALRAFRAAAWSTEAELSGFALDAATSGGPSDVAKWLAVLTDPLMRADRAAHVKRLRVFAYVAERIGDPALFLAYARALRANDSQLRAILVALLPRVNSVAGHGELCRLLGAAEPELRAAASAVLAQVGGKAAFDLLVEFVADPAFAGRIDAIDLMMPRATHHSIPLLAAVLAAGRPHERAHALRALGDAHFREHGAVAADLAARALSDPDSRIVAQAVSIVAQYATESDFYARVHDLLWSKNISEEKAVVDALRRFPSPRTSGILARKLREGANVIRVAVIETAEAIGDDSIVSTLVEGLMHTDLVVRGAALQVLGRLSDTGRVDPARAILWLLRSRDVNVRRIAVEVLNRVGDPKGELAPRLLVYLRDEDWWVRERTMDALIEMAGSGLTRHLVPYLSDRSPVVRRFAVGALKRIRDPIAIRALLACAQYDDDWWVREESVVALAQMGDARVIEHIVVLSVEHPDLRLVCVEALVTLRAVDAIDHIVAFTLDGNPDVRAAAVRAIAELGGRDYAETIERFAEDPSPRVRRFVRDLLARWKVCADPTVRGHVALDRLLAAVVEGDADDLVLVAGRVPYVKRRGQIEAMPEAKALPDESLRHMLKPLLSVVQWRQFSEGRDVDCSHEMRALGVRFRVNIFTQATGIAAVFRIIKNDALLIVLENLGLPPSVGALASLKDGLVLVGGPTGSGKSTTLAAIVQRINLTQGRHILTIEDPIETVHIGERSLITQRELGSHTSSFPSALRAALRQDPDVIVVGEMRDPQTFQFAVSAAETGHLVLGTMHTASAETSVARIVNSFPSQQQPQVRAMLAASLRAVICQSLLRRKSGTGRAVAAEVLLNTDAVANLIRKCKEFQIPTVLATGRSAGMCLMDHELARLVREDVVEVEEAFARAVDKAGFPALVAGADPWALRRSAVSSRPAPSAPASGAPGPGPGSQPRLSQRPERG